MYLTKKLPFNIETLKKAIDEIGIEPEKDKKGFDIGRKCL